MKKRRSRRSGVQSPPRAITWMASDPSWAGSVAIDEWLTLRELDCLALTAEHSVWEPEENGAALWEVRSHGDAASSSLVKCRLTGSLPSWPHRPKPSTLAHNAGSPGACQMNEERAGAGGHSLS